MRLTANNDFAACCEHHCGQTRLREILRHDRVSVMGTDVCGVVLYADDAWAVVSLDNGFEVTCSLDQVRLAGH